MSNIEKLLESMSEEDAILFVQLLYRMSLRDALQTLRDRKITPSGGWKEQEELHRKGAFVVAQVTTAAILQSIHEELQEAIDKGEHFEEFAEKIEEKFSQSGWTAREDGSPWRWYVTYQTNMRSAYQAARFDQAVAAEEEFPFLEYVAVSDSRTRPDHLALSGTILPIRHDFWKSHTPPNGYACRCRIRSVDIGTLEDNGINPEGTFDNSAHNLKTGKRVDIKKHYHDEGFATHPSEGVAKKIDLDRFLEPIRNDLEKAIQ